MSLFFTRPDRSFHPGAFPMPRVVRVCVPDAPEYLHGLRALFVSDVHLRRSVSDDRLQALTALMAAQKADLLLVIGPHSGRVRDGAITGGMDPEKVQVFEDRETLTKALKALAKPEDTILFKASHGIHLELVLADFLKKEK